jgi:superfamily I DNA/RNA helicase
MQFVIANTFQDSLGRLQTNEQNAAKLAAYELQANPAHPGLQMHKLDKAKDKNFWSARVNDDVRLIVRRTDNSCLLCYVDHHDQAYAWAERRKLTIHPTTGAAQMILLQEKVQEIVIRKYVEDQTRAAAKSLLQETSDEELLRYGVPVQWLEAVRQASDEEAILQIAGQLPEEAAEAVLNLATGVKHVRAKKIIHADVWTPVAAPAIREISPLHKLNLAIPSKNAERIRAAMAAKGPDDAKIEVRAFEHPDAQRRFRTVADIEELRLAMDAPWEKWTVFLHPAQRHMVERQFNGPAKVAGAAGTGKTIVALHRAVHLAEVYPTSRVLLTTFSDVLAHALRTKLRALIGSRPRLGEQIEVLPMRDVGLRLYESNLASTRGKAKIVTPERLSELLAKASEDVGEHKFSLRFILTEWEQVVNAWQLKTWEEYRDVSRLGRKTRLREPQRELLWSIFTKVMKSLSDAGEMTKAEMFNNLAKHYADGAAPPFDFAVVDEAQDVSVAELRCLAALAGKRADGLFFAGDTGQRIFQQPFSWKSLGVDVRGRSSMLKVNYRTSHQIRLQADRLLDPEIADVDGNVEDRRGTVSVFNGPAPEIIRAVSEQQEQEAVAAWLTKRIEEGLRPDEMVIFVRSATQLQRAEAAAARVKLQCKPLNRYMETTVGTLPVCTMHLAKGLEFRAVAVMACDEGILPLEERIETATDPSELEDIYNTERQLLYVACTRARDCLLVTSAGTPSEFILDLGE